MTYYSRQRLDGESRCFSRSILIHCVALLYRCVPTPISITMHVEVFLGPKRSPSAFEGAFPEQNVHGKRVLISMRCKVPARGAATTSEHCVMASSPSTIGVLLQNAHWRGRFGLRAYYLLMAGSLSL